jgi:hypothetical protein
MILNFPEISEFSCGEIDPNCIQFEVDFKWT